MQSKHQAKKVIRLLRQTFLARRSGTQVTALHHIIISGVDTPFLYTHLFAELGKVQHFEQLIRKTVDLRYKVVFRIESTKLRIVCYIGHMAAVCGN